MKYRRNWDCSVCRKPLIYDSEGHYVKCDCNNGEPFYMEIPYISLRNNFTTLKEKATA